MRYWLFKQEPSAYGYADLERDGETTWDGVANAQALIHLRQVAKGDEIFFYHTGKEKAVVAIMKAAANALEPTKGEVSVRVKPVCRLARPVTLAEIKRDPLLADWELTRYARLSIMPVSPQQWRRVLALSAAPDFRSSARR